MDMDAHGPGHGHGLGLDLDTRSSDKRAAHACTRAALGLHHACMPALHTLVTIPHIPHTTAPALSHTPALARPLSHLSPSHLSPSLLAVPAPLAPLLRAALALPCPALTN
jgi:hypothetical protein